MISKALDDLKGINKFVILDSITVLLEERGLSQGMRFIRTIAAKTRITGISLLASFTPEAISPAATALVQEAMDGIIELKMQESRGKLVRFIRIPRMTKLKHSTEWYEFSFQQHYHKAI